jgi:hypothetical protein
VITGPTLQIEAEVRGGSLVLVTKPGIEVDADEVAVRGPRQGPAGHRLKPAGHRLKPAGHRLKTAGDLEGSDLGRGPRRQHCGASTAADILAMVTAQAKDVQRVRHALMTPDRPAWSPRSCR